VKDVKDADWEEDSFHTVPKDEEPRDTHGDVRIEAGGRAFALFYRGDTVLPGAALTTQAVPS